MIDVRDEQPLNAQSSIFVTLLGMLIDVRDEQPPNAQLPMLVTLMGKVEFRHPTINALSAVLIMALQFSRES